VELNVVIRIYDITGNFVVELSNENNINGNIIWNGKNSNNNRVPAGLYTYTLEVTDEYGNVTVQQQKLIKLSK
jgi:flagellar hook assembly protein FlgD